MHIVCESCKLRPAAVVIDPDGDRFRVCAPCAMPTMTTEATVLELRRPALVLELRR